ncbi:hypothetical protein F4811DRAFT_551504 [Daldinia bambusicola]|nr:hypothetical protein F4811DRAFT_551504 [Daldinia bambusicola]
MRTTIKAIMRMITEATTAATQAAVRAVIMIAAIAVLGEASTAARAEANTGAATTATTKALRADELRARGRPCGHNHLSAKSPGWLRLSRRLPNVNAVGQELYRSPQPQDRYQSHSEVDIHLMASRMKQMPTETPAGIRMQTSTKPLAIAKATK